MSTPEQNQVAEQQLQAQASEATQAIDEASSFLTDLGVNGAAEDAAFLELEEAIEDEATFEVKSNHDFRIVFKAESGKKPLPGSKLAAERVSRFSFTRLLGAAAPAEAEDAPKKRGRKPKAEKAATEERAIHMAFWDDSMNAAIDFIESLSEEENFRVFFYTTTIVDGEQVDTERFVFKGCNLIAQKRTEVWESPQTKSTTPRSLPLSISYSDVARSSLVTADAEQE